MQSKYAVSLEGFAKSGILAGQVQVQWLVTNGASKMAAEKGHISSKGLQLKLRDGPGLTKTSFVDCWVALLIV